MSRQGVIDLLAYMHVKKTPVRYKEIKDYLRGDIENIREKLLEHNLLEKTIVKEGTNQYEAYQLTPKAKYFLECQVNMNVKFP